jgi:hypothetical protein
MERQRFGFDYQKIFFSNGLTENKKYTGKYDGYSKNGTPIQVKTYKNKQELMMANPYRYLEADKDFYLVVANRDRNNNILSERIFYVTIEALKKLFTSNNFQERTKYCQYCLDSVTNDRTDDTKFKNLMKKEKQSRKAEGNIINVQTKRDHKSQKRVQWSIPNRHLEDFYSFFQEVNKEDLMK